MSERSLRRLVQPEITMKRVVAIAASSLVLLLGSAPAGAVIVTYNVPLSSLQSVPANGSTAFGAATVTVDDVLDTVFVSMTFTGLTGGVATVAHIHCCVATNANGPVVIPFTGFPSLTSGTYINTFTGISAATITGIEAGLAYINIHDATFLAGEIRGDILAAAVAPVPEPESAALMLAGLAMLGVYGRRRARPR